MLTNLLYYRHIIFTHIFGIQKHVFRIPNLKEQCSNIFFFSFVHVLDRAHCTFFFSFVHALECAYCILIICHIILFFFLILCWLSMVKCNNIIHPCKFYCFSLYILKYFKKCLHFSSVQVPECAHCIIM